MTAQKKLEIQAAACAETLENFALYDNEKLVDFLAEEVQDAEITLDRYCRYNGAKVFFAVNGYGFCFETKTGKLHAHKNDVSTYRWVHVDLCDAVDDYFEDYYNVCR